jgi:eukaryotic-like serine/threonine-protein kinase
MPDSRYRITERIAAGGMAEVFKGVAESLQGFRKSIAIKRVLPALTKNKKFVAMFLDEARLSLHLQHANIVQVFDIGHADETYFIVMEYVDGVDLKQMLEWRRRIGKRLTIGQTIYLMMEISKGLAYAHDLVHPETGRPLGIVHRDVSPPNVLMSRNGEVKLADFGLAKAASQLETTDPGVVKGKMSYLSPEAARGEEVDRRADIFSAGILLYEMLTAKRLFYGDSDYQTVELVRAAKVPPIAPQNPEVEAEIEEVCRKALAKRVEDRFQTAADLQDALAHYLFSRGLKMIQRDIADLVRGCLEDLATLSGAKRPRPNIIDTLLHEEIHSFTSVEFDDANAAPPAPPTTGEVPTSGDFVDPRAWADDSDWTNRRAVGRRSPTNHGRRSTGAIPAPAPDPHMAAVEAAFARRAAEAARPPVPPGAAGPSTPPPERLADALEPVARLPSRSGGLGQRWVGKGVIIGVVLGAAAVGALFAALLARH